MSLHRYGVLRGRAIDRAIDIDDGSPHYQFLVDAAGVRFRVAINVKPVRGPSALLYVIDDDFRHPLTHGLAELPAGFTRLPSRPDGLALDYLRGNLFGRYEMRPLPFTRPGPDNDLKERLDAMVARSMRDEDAAMFVFGERWGPEPGEPDQIFRFDPGNGIHNVHMNQGNAPDHRGDDGVWQDGGLLVQGGAGDRWVALFLAFQAQAWFTDDRTGHRLTRPRHRTPDHRPDTSAHQVRIVAARVNPVGPAPEAETVTLHNHSSHAVDLTEWAIVDAGHHRQRLIGLLDPGATRTVLLAPDVQLGNSGGSITLLDADDRVIDSVIYREQAARREGEAIVFS